jgi:hypothetical protein
VLSSVKPNKSHQQRRYIILVERIHVFDTGVIVIVRFQPNCFLSCLNLYDIYHSYVSCLNLYDIYHSYVIIASYCPVHL